MPCISTAGMAHYLICFCIQQSTCSEECHLCVVRYDRLSFTVCPPLLGIKSGNAIAAILTLYIAIGTEKLYGIAQCISYGSAYERASYSVSQFIIVHILHFI